MIETPHNITCFALAELGSNCWPQLPLDHSPAALWPATTDIRLEI